MSVTTMPRPRIKTLAGHDVAISVTDNEPDHQADTEPVVTKNQRYSQQSLASIPSVVCGVTS